MTRHEYTHRLGTTDSGDSVVIETEIENTVNRGTRQTITHEEVTDAYCIHFMDHVYEKRARDSWRGGQIVDALLEITKPAPGWTLAEIREVHDMWKRWHLNTMNGGCAHQEVVWEDSPYRRPSLTQTPACPETGYKYGHAWLTEVLPDDVIERFHYLMREREI